MRWKRYEENSLGVRQDRMAVLFSRSIRIRLPRAITSCLYRTSTECQFPGYSATSIDSIFYRLFQFPNYAVLCALDRPVNSSSTFLPLAARFQRRYQYPRDCGCVCSVHPSGPYQGERPATNRGPSEHWGGAGPADRDSGPAATPGLSLSLGAVSRACLHGYWGTGLVFSQGS